MRSATLLVALHATQALLAPSTVTKTPARLLTAAEPEMCRALQKWPSAPAGLDSLKDADYAMYLQAGDFGFDPLGWAEVGWGLNEGESCREERDDRLYAYREAELKHGRLAMLAAVGLAARAARRRRLSMRLGMRRTRQRRRRARRRPRAFITQRRPRPGGDGLLGRRAIL